jgi:hypothetical protein
MKIDFGFIVAALLFLGDIFWFNGLKLSQLGILLLVLMIYRENLFISKRALVVAVFIIIYNVLLNLLNINLILNSTIKALILSSLLLCAFNIRIFTYEKLLSYYVYFSSLVVMIWWIQMVAFVSSLIGPFSLEIIYDSSLWSDAGSLHMVGKIPRLNSFYSEPSYLGLFLLPLFAMKFRYHSKFLVIIILIPIIMTFSLNVYFGLISIFIMNLRWSIKTLLVVGLLTLLFLFLGLDTYILHRISMTTDRVDLTLLIYIIHVKIFLSNWYDVLIGYGVDNYYLMFENWRSNLDDNLILSIAKTIPDEDLMLRSGPLLIVRLMVEFGLVVFLFFIFSIRKYILVNTYWIYGLIGLSLRDGDYLRPFFLFFLIMHITYSIIYHKQIINERSNAIHSLQS